MISLTPQQVIDIYAGIKCPHCGEELELEFFGTAPINETFKFSVNKEDALEECMDFNDVLNQRLKSLLDGEESVADAQKWAAQYKLQSF